MTVYQSFRQYLLLRVKPLSFGDDSMIIREHYMTQIRPFYESNLIKIITGIRRCGTKCQLHLTGIFIECQTKKP